MKPILRSFSCSVLGILSVICLFLVMAETCHAEDVSLETILQGIEYNDSLLRNAKGTFIVKVQRGEFLEVPTPVAGTEVKLASSKTIETLFYAIDYEDQRIRCNIECFKDDGTGILTEEKKAYVSQRAFDGVKRYTLHDTQLQMISAGSVIPEASDPDSFGLTYTPVHTGYRWGQLLRKMAVELKGTETIDGASCYVLEFTKGDEIPSKVKVWVNPENGYRVERRLTQSSRGGSEVYDVEYKEFPDGARFPVKGRKRWFTIKSDGTIKVDMSFVMSVDESAQQLEVNGNLADSLFAIDPPKGTMIVNLDTRISYVKGKEDKVYFIQE